MCIGVVHSLHVSVVDYGRWEASSFGSLGTVLINNSAVHYNVNKF